MSDLSATDKGRQTSVNWRACRRCGTAASAVHWRQNAFVCRVCNFHRRIGFSERVSLITDEKSFNEVDVGVAPGDPLNWRADGQTYADLLDSARSASGAPESFRYGRAKIATQPVLFGGFEFKFLGGTLGSVTGEKIARMLDRAAETSVPAVIFTSSGGARMQEGMISLMQMSKIAVSISRLNRSGGSLITVICDPTTGGVAASLAFMGDFVLAEPGALAGFAGPRVILQTIGEEMPPDVQTTDRLCRDGFVDQIVDRRRLREVLAERVRVFL